MEKYLNLGYLSSIFSLVLTSLQDNVTYQIISLVIVVISFMVNLSYTGFKWYNEAKKDGKITPEEIEKLLEELKEEMEDLKK